MQFEDLYKSLNSEQKNAVDTIEGTVMVVAGPGTGKTQVLGARVANILRLTDAKAENILCLTFTEAATVALRDRLYQFISTDAQRVNIYTYHAFCNMVIQENKSLFGYQELDPASEIEVLEIVKEIIDELPANHELKRYRGDIYFDTNSLISLFNLLKKDGLQPAEVYALCDEYLNDIENDESFRLKRDSKNGKKGDFKQIYFAEQEKIERLRAAVALYDAYIAKMAHRKRYDYNDMINWVTAEFLSNHNLLLQYQEQYQYILVDEYQDTNGSQNQLLMLLINYWDNPNVFVVGDDDQSIYKFQGANVENIKMLYEAYSKYVKLIVLTENYRSTPSILNVSNTLISNNTERLVGQIDSVSKEISASNPEVIALDSAVNIISYPNTQQEVIELANSIKVLSEKGVKLKNIAVLYRNHKQSDDLVKYLQAEKISFNISMAKDILDEPLIHQLLQLLEYLDLESQKLDKGQHLLFEILHSKNFVHLTPFEIASLSVQLKKQYDLAWREAIHSMIAKEERGKLSTESFKELKQFIADLEYWHKELHNSNLQTVVEHVISKGGFIGRALASSDNLYEVQCLKTFFNFLKSETAKNPYLTLTQFLDTINILKENKLGLSLTKVVYGADGVNLMTVHGSKGLEFEHVFIMGCTADKWEKNGQSLPFNMNRIVKGEPKLAHEEEGRRLFYVGLTRAKHNLTISYSMRDAADKPLNRSVYVAEIEDSEYTHIKHSEIREIELLDFFQKTMQQENKAYLKLTQMDFIKQELENFRMSATNLNSYLKCPVSFFYQTIVRVPSALNESMSFGTAVHGALEALIKQKSSSETQNLPKSEFLVTEFKKALSRHRESFTEIAYKRKLEFGNTILPQYYEARKSQWLNEHNSQTELSFKNIEINGIPIRGQIDKIIIGDRDIKVVDYKTGNYNYAKAKINPPLSSDKLKEGELDHNKIYGGDYWRQIMFYYILIQQDPRFSKSVSSGILDFIEPVKGEFIQEEIAINPSDVEIVRMQIKTVYDAIINGQFEKGCNKEDCVWCNFNNYYLKRKNYKLADLLSTEAEEIDER